MPHTLWYTRCPVPTAFSIAVRKGWIQAAFAPDGIAVRSLSTTTDRQARQSHFQHTQPNFFRHGGSIPPLVSRSRGADLRLIGLSFNEGLRVILVRPDSAIRTVADLAGKRISIPRRVNDPIDFWRATVVRGFRDMLEREGLSLNDVVRTEVAIDRAFVDDAQTGTRAEDSLWGASFMLGHQREEALALVRGEVDAIYSQGAIAATVEGFLGARAIVDSGDAARRAAAPYTLTVSGALLDEAPEIVDRLVEQVLRAGRWAAGEETEAKRIVALDAGIAEDLVDRAFSPDIHKQLAVDLSPESVERLRVQHQSLLDEGFITTPVDFDTFIDVGPLRRASERLNEAWSTP